MSGALIGLAVSELPTVINAIEDGAAVAPDLIAQVQTLFGAHQTNADRLTAFEAALGDVVGFLTHTFPSHHGLSAATVAVGK